MTDSSGSESDRPDLIQELTGVWVGHLNQTRHELIQAKETIKMMNRRVNIEKAQKERAQNQVDEKQNEINTLKQEKRTWKEENTRLKQRHQQATKEHKQEVINLQTQLLQLKTQLKTISDSININALQ
eukprot:181481_1